MQNVWIIGCGDIGFRVAHLLKAQQYDVTKLTALVRSEKSALRCEKENLNFLQYDLDSNESLPSNDFNDACIYYFAPPQKDGVVDLRFQSFLSQIKEKAKRLVLISTTGVYGDSRGQWIDENTPLAAQTGRAKRRVSAENQLIEWAEHFTKEYIILRVPGIYGQHRLPITRLEKQLPVILASESGFTNRIHADDLACICIEAMNSAISGEIFNTTDGNPSYSVDYMNYLADHLNYERPPQISLLQAKAEMSEIRYSYAKESRRIRNDKMLKLLKIKLEYPTYQSLFTE